MTHALPSVAIVDDDESVLKALRRLLSAAGFDARAFQSGREFLDALAGNGFGCVLLDIQMPGLSGFAVARELSGKIPVIFITAHDEAENRRRAKQQGAVGFLRKPASEKKILAAIREALNRESGPADEGESRTKVL